MTDEYKELTFIDEDITVDIQGFTEELVYTGDYESIDLDHLDYEAIHDLLTDVLKMEVRKPLEGEDLCPPSIFFRTGYENFVNILVSDGTLSLCKPSEGACDDWVNVSVDEAIESIASLTDYSESNSETGSNSQSSKLAWNLITFGIGLAVLASIFM
jgi:hypothetical protein